MKRLFIFALACGLPGCVVTTIEGPGAPPRVAPPPSRPVAEAASPPSNEPESVVARHILVAYRGSMRASAVVTRTKEEAHTRAEEALTRARAGEDFADLVRQFSDEPGAADRGGDLGSFKRGMMVKPFADAAFKLAPGELSDLVETPFGFHVIQRTE